MLTPENLEVVMICLEGPDQYSQAGGLGVRARELCRATAAMGFRTTLAFVGDPDLPSEEVQDGVRLLRRAQAVSRRHPAGVYQGEEEKIAELESTLPAHLIETVIGPAAAAGRIVAVLLEEWQTAGVAAALSGALVARGIRNRCVLLWNANNQYGFDRLHWGTLGLVATITTVSRYMKQLMWPWGVNPMVIGNGIPESALTPVDPQAVRVLSGSVGAPCLAFKIGRFSPDKRWHQAVDGLAALRSQGVDARLLMRGGIEPFGGEVLERCVARGLAVADLTGRLGDAADLAAALRACHEPVLNVRTFLPDRLVTVIYAASTAVLANSGHEPFGLVGLEAMAAGGVAVVGATGEEYAHPYHNAIVIETDDGAEVAGALRGLVERRDLARRIRSAARRDAADYTWPRVIEGLLERLRYICDHQGVPVPVPTPRTARRRGAGQPAAG